MYSNNNQFCKLPVCCLAMTLCMQVNMFCYRDVYSVTIEAVSLEGADSYVSPAVQCQVKNKNGLTPVDIHM